MRVIKLELPGAISSLDATISLASEELRAQLLRQIQAVDYELSEHVRQRASSYFPPSYSVFVRTLFVPDELRTLTELWIVDPTIRWPQGLLARSAWRLLVPVLAHTVREAYHARLQSVAIQIEEKQARLTVLAPVRGWRDPVLVGIGVFILTTLFWVAAQPWISQQLAGAVR